MKLIMQVLISICVSILMIFLTYLILYHLGIFVKPTVIPEESEQIASSYLEEKSSDKDEKNQENPSVTVIDQPYKIIKKAAIDLKDGSVDICLTGRGELNHIYYCDLDKVKVEVNLGANRTLVSFRSRPESCSASIPEKEDEPIYFGVTDGIVIQVTSSRIKKEWEKRIQRAIDHYDKAPKNIIPDVY